MSIREIDLAQFNEFARQQIESGRGDVSLSSLAEQWERRQQSIQVHENAEHRNPQVARARAYVEILARQQGVAPVRSAEDLRFDFLNPRDDLDDFLRAIKAARQQDKVRDPLND
ncbi:MAG: hypothetical protein JNM43_00265 [Planctomycetaceae bacterium]|nr:hypothetical protein [Planctomycetaceae bacterium]